MDIHIVRHGESMGNTNPDKDMPDSELTAKGIYQAKEVCNYLKYKNITKIYSSPLIRALQTAQPLAMALGLPIIALRELSEHRETASYIGLTKEKLTNRFPEGIYNFTFQQDGWFYEGNNTVQSTQNRADTFNDHVISLDDSEKICIFAHGHYNQYLIKSLLNIKQPNLHIHQDNACIHSFQRNKNIVTIHSLCSTRHLS
ncbi:histidine phosphatase family protein [Gracilibacillus phocaeensis]|uniref:histidine phosphatase family protein n=1 Tax=Gracilibacillus phocaeensis TaxID=2042304 RepID=UPI0010325930|nr:histidine phosphatase family protein [Gracilibacillus phocaeensis]